MAIPPFRQEMNDAADAERERRRANTRFRAGSIAVHLARMETADQRHGVADALVRGLRDAGIPMDTEVVTPNVEARGALMPSSPRWAQRLGRATGRTRGLPTVADGNFPRRPMDIHHVVGEDGPNPVARGWVLRVKERVGDEQYIGSDDPRFRNQKANPVTATMLVLLEDGAIMVCKKPKQKPGPLPDHSPHRLDARQVEPWFINGSGGVLPLDDSSYEGTREVNDMVALACGQEFGLGRILADYANDAISRGVDPTVFDGL